MNIQDRRLRRLFVHNKNSRLPPKLLPRLKRNLAILESAEQPSDLTSYPGLRMHRLHGVQSGFWSISVSGNWRLTFRFEEREVVDVELVD